MLATGFETSRYLSGLDVIGIGGENLHDRWGLDPRAYLGVAVSGFPNFFMLYGPNTNQGANSIIYILEAGARLVASAVSRLAQTRRLSRCATRRRTPVQRTDLRRSGADDLDAMRQLLPITHRSYRHAVAALGTRLRTGDVANTVSATGSTRPKREPLSLSGLLLCRAASRRLLGGGG